MSPPLAGLTGPIRALFTDLDGTLTTGGLLESETYAALTGLSDANIDFVIVTGRPAGWGQALASLTSARAVITENGGVVFVRYGKAWKKLYGVPLESLPEWRGRMQAAAADAMAAVPGITYSGDSVYREVDLALDWNEECSLPVAHAEKAAAVIRNAGFTAVRSSVHVNFGPPVFNKFSACQQLLQLLYPGCPEHEFVYVGDSLNDAPMFGGFSKSVGVANVREWWSELDQQPRFVTAASEGAGVRELVEHILRMMS